MSAHATLSVMTVAEIARIPSRKRQSPLRGGIAVKTRVSEGPPCQSSWTEAAWLLGYGPIPSQVNRRNPLLATRAGNPIFSLLNVGRSARIARLNQVARSPAARGCAGLRPPRACPGWCRERSARGAPCVAKQWLGDDFPRWSVTPFGARVGAPGSAG